MRNHKKSLIFSRAKNCNKSCVKSSRPVDFKRAKSLGYKAGMTIVIGRINRGGCKPSMVNHGRSTKKLLKRKNTRLSLQNRVEKRISRRYKQLEVVNSYFVGKTGKYKWFEVLLSFDLKKGRAQRGLTSCARKNL